MADNAATDSGFGSDATASDSGEAPIDGGLSDAGESDSGSVAPSSDASLDGGFEPDAEPLDLGSPDLGSDDAAEPDAAGVDAGTIDASSPDVGIDDAGPRLSALQIPEDRVPTWYPIPDSALDTSGWAVIDVTDHGADPADNSGNDAAAVRDAIAAAAPQTIIYFPPGTYNIGQGGFGVFRSDLVLRGAGAAQTILKITTARSGPYRPRCGRAMIMFCGDTAGGPSVTWTSGFARGDLELGVSNASSFSPGDWIFAEQENDPNVIENPQPNAGPVMNHIAKVTAKNGNTITIDRPLRYNFSSSGKTVAKMDPISRVGIEGMKMEYIGVSADVEYEVPIRFTNVVNGFILDSWMTDFWNVELSLERAARNLVRGNRFDRLLRSSPYNKAAVYIDRAAHDNVFENNASSEARVVFLLQLGASGNVIAYNHMSGGSCERHVFFHGGFAAENLIEGNDTDCRIDLDNYWGRQGPRNTLFRNRTRGAPDDTVHIRTHRDSGTRLVTSFLNVLLNATGRMHGAPGGIGDVDRGVVDMWIERNVVRGQLHLDSPEPSTTSIENHHGDVAPASWSSLSFPASLYLESRPSYWPTNKAWPAIGADVDDFSAGGTLEPLPAATLP